MRISRPIRFFIGFAILTFVEIGLIYLFGPKPTPNWLIYGTLMLGLFVIAVLGMIWALICGIIAAYKCRRRPIHYRLAQLDDVPALEALIPLSARGLQAAYYSSEQIEGAIGPVFGVDSQLIKDGTYFVAVEGEKIVGCGGWSKRKTLYGSDRAKKEPDPLRNPATEPAMIRAFFVHPDYARCGIGRRIMELSEEASGLAGFAGIEIVATLAGVPLYAAFKYEVVEHFDIALMNGASMPVVRMRKADAAGAGLGNSLK